MMLERFSYDLKKWFRYMWVFVICFISQWMERSKHGLLVFQPKKTLIILGFLWRRHRSIGQLCCKITSKWRVVRFLESSSGMKFFQPRVHFNNQPKTKRICIHSTNPSNHSISIYLLFLFCSRNFKVIRTSLYHQVPFLLTFISDRDVLSRVSLVLLHLKH